MTPKWDRYIGRFHASSAGITEELLGPARDATGLSPYAWLLDAAPEDSSLTVDIGCGSAPTGVGRRGWVGVDRSLAELRRGVDHGRGTVLQGESARLPFPDGCATTVVASMSLMVVSDPVATLSEARRVLQPGGTLLVLLPTVAPLNWSDRLRMGSILAVVGKFGFPFPHREVLRRSVARLASAGFDIEHVEARRFAVPLPGPRDGERFVRSLYLPDVPGWRIRLALRTARRWRGELGIPLRRIVARRPLAVPTSA